MRSETVAVDKLLEDAEPFIINATRRYERQSWDRIHDIDDLRQEIRIFVLEMANKHDPLGEVAWSAKVNRTVRWRVIQFWRSHGTVVEKSGNRRVSPAFLSELAPEFGCAVYEPVDRFSGDGFEAVDMNDLLEKLLAEPDYVYLNGLRAVGLNNKEACSVAGIAEWRGYEYTRKAPAALAMERIRELIA